MPVMLRNVTHMGLPTVHVGITRLTEVCMCKPGFVGERGWCGHVGWTSGHRNEDVLNVWACIWLA